MMKRDLSKKAWLKFYLTIGAFSALWFLLFYLINRLANNMDDALYFGTPISAYITFFLCAALFGIISRGIYSSIQEGKRQKFKQEDWIGTKAILKRARIPILISLPFLYLGLTNFIVLTEEDIAFQPYWSLNKIEYSWESDITAAVVDYSISIDSDSRKESFDGKYILHFNDGKSIDLWADTFEGHLGTIMKVDKLVRKKNIPFYVNRAPSEAMINKFFSTDAENIRKLYYER